MRFLRIFLFCLIINLIACAWEETENNPMYLPLDDSEYPYAGIPRLVIETADFQQVKDKQTKVPAKLQIWEKNEPKSTVMELTIKGRGSASFKKSKSGYKLDFAEAQSLLQMPKDKEWALISNFGDKTHLRNLISFKLSSLLGAIYTPQSQFVELYLNRQYMGIYLLSETIKIGNHRVHIPKNDYSFLFEKETEQKLDTPYVETSSRNVFHIRYPKQPSEIQKELLKDHLDKLEKYLDSGNLRDINNWIDLKTFFPFYWTQEFSRNIDGNFNRSIYLTWSSGSQVKFGPVWDFDLAYGNTKHNYTSKPDGWFARSARWNKSLLSDPQIKKKANAHWIQHRKDVLSILDTINVYAQHISDAVKNEYARWPSLESTENSAYLQSFSSYEQAIDSLKTWIIERFQWIDSKTQ